MPSAPPRHAESSVAKCAGPSTRRVTTRPGRSSTPAQRPTWAR
ncbi:Uncharacterised protein [Mycobacteroides abscessus]|nr:Uncharacterised protein [Mycobacteroides abscessus]